jgi:hypothetical protein
MISDSFFIKQMFFDLDADCIVSEVQSDNDGEPSLGGSLFYQGFHPQVIRKNNALHGYMHLREQAVFNGIVLGAIRRIMAHHYR